MVDKRKKPANKQLNVSVEVYDRLKLKFGESFSVVITRVNDNDLVFAVYQDREKPNPRMIYYDLARSFGKTHHMRQRGVVSDNEWTGWLRWMRSAFRHDTINEIWKNNVEVEKWFDPAFQEFIDKELCLCATKQ
jgi:hypothetical protein